MCDIIHRRHYDTTLYLDSLFKLSKFFKIQMKLLDTIHILTDRVIEQKTKAMNEKFKNGEQKKLTQNDKSMEKIDTAKNAENTRNSTKLHYARDDLDDIDENDVGEKKRLAFLEMMIECKRNNGQMTDEEIREEVNTIMFEV